jgi:putative radical SAM enzyme (TIGR03279 family)
MSSYTPVHMFVDAERGTKERALAPEPRGGLIDAVEPDSLAVAAGLRPGMRVLAADGRPLRDVIDYQFYTAEPSVTLTVQHEDGVEHAYHFDKHPDDDLGLAFADATWDGVRICANTCFFCFLKGLPKGLRRTLYIKDDDYRLSFLHGNFVTLTNLTEADWQRLAEQRLSPLNVSVHATDLDLRRRMLGYDEAPDIIAQLRRLGDLGIRAHTQIVLCPGVNDGAALEQSARELAALYPVVQTVSVVPVGATEQFEQRMGAVGKTEGVQACSPEYARDLIRLARPLQRAFRQDHGATVLYLADEYYLIAAQQRGALNLARLVPGAAAYDGFPQYENGIGMTRTLLDDWRRTRAYLRIHRPALPDVRLAVGCGTLITPVLADLFREFSAETGIAAAVRPVRNEHFGARINVSGLLTGGDYLSALRDAPGDVVVLPRPSLDYFGRRFLDSMTAAELAGALGRPVLYAADLSDVVAGLAHLAATGHAPDPAQPEATNGIFWATGAGVGATSSES